MKENSSQICGRNPVLEALKSGREIERLLVQEGAGGSIGKILSLAKSKGVPIRYEKKDNLDRKARGSSHQGVIAYVSAYSYASLEDAFRLAEERGEPPFLILLDELEDPHNLGAIMRTAECAGAHGVVITKRRAAGITETVAKASAGAVEYLPCIKVNNMARTIEELQARGVWIYACDMDGTSYVARAANMAARKGILVCNSAGNEGDESEWKTIITPADADSVLCVGGIENSLTEYNHISFSSYGPSADGRQKPNVCAFGYARTANVTANDAYHYVHGTSFSCPLVAGFAACAWQATPGKTAMEMMKLLERSSDLYPYCDYAYGYGVPQAGYFTGERKAAEPTFRLAEEDGQIRLVPATQLSSEPIFYKEVRPDGSIVRFGKKTLIYMDSLTNLLFTVAEGNTLVVHAGGYTTQIQGHEAKSRAWGTVDTKPGAIFAGTMSTEYRDETMNTPSKWGTDATWRKDIYFAFGLPLKTAGGELASDVWSPATRLGARIMRGLCKVYSLGIGVEYGNTRYNYMDQPYNTTETTLGADSVAGTYDEILRRYVNQGELTLELFQRIRLSSVALLTGKGFNWDLGVYGSYGWNRYKLRGKATAMPASSQNTVYYNPSPIDAYRWNWGVATRLTYDNIGLYARYRLNGIGKETPADKVLMPRLEIGAQIAF